MIDLCGVREQITKRDIKIRLLLLTGIAFSVARLLVSNHSPLRPLIATPIPMKVKVRPDQVGDDPLATGNLAQSLGDFAQKRAAVIARNREMLHLQASGSGTGIAPSVF